MNKKTNVNIELGGPCFLLFLVFLVLKLCKVIEWSWWWVTAPLWIPLGIAIAIMLIILVVAGIATIVEKISDARWRKNYNKRHK